MATKIVATRKQSSAYGDHVHVAFVKTVDGRVFSRAEAVQRIDSGWEAFYTEYAGRRAGVYVRRCSHCDLRFITTKPDSITGNNLLDLPDF